MKKYLKKILCTVVCAFGSAAAFAEGEAGSGSINVSYANTAFTEAKTALTGFVSANAPTISAVLGAFLGLTLIFVAYGWIRRAAKGR